MPSITNFPLSVDSACPACGEVDGLDSFDDDKIDGQYIELWDCGLCRAQFNVIYTFAWTEKA